MAGKNKFRQVKSRKSGSVAQQPKESVDLQPVETASKSRGPSALLLGAVAAGLAVLLAVGLWAVLFAFSNSNTKIAEKDKTPPIKNTVPEKVHIPEFLTGDPVLPKVDENPEKQDPGPPPKTKTASKTSDKKIDKGKEPPKSKENGKIAKKKVNEKDKTTVTESETGGLKIKVIQTVSTDSTTGRPMLRLAVSRPHYDDMGKLLGKLGQGYRYTQLAEDEILLAERLAEFDVLFLTCSTGNTDPKLAKTLRAFVENGGTLYASDLRFDALVRAFPKYINPRGRSLNGLGDQTVTATVADPGLKEIVGDKIKLHFNSGGWRPGSFDRRKVKVYIDGQYRTTSTQRPTGFAPFLIKFSHGEGTVIFTSFHNEAQNSETEMKLLEFLVFAAVTAKIETTVTKTMISGGFSPQQSRRIGISLDQPQAKSTYKNKQNGPLRFALGFRKAGAKLRLTLVSPKGQKIEREGESTFSVEVNNAPAGDWQYTITAVSVPYRNFPFTLTVGEGK